MSLQQLRRTPRTRQQHRNATPASEVVEDTPTEEPPESADEETRPSSDLEDCPDLWWSELGNYIIETHKRQKQVDAWFSRWIIVSFQHCVDGLHAHYMTTQRNATPLRPTECPTTTGIGLLGYPSLLPRYHPLLRLWMRK